VFEVLATVGLDHLKPLLDTEDRWDRRLSDAEKKRLLIARVILQKPRSVVFNGAMVGLDRETRRRIEVVFGRDLADVGVLNIGQYPNESGFFTCSLRLAHEPSGRCFKPFDAAEDGNVETAALPAL
jgi:ABC-type uncharacterized transport system fused permease/ATPase subunit